MTSFRRVTNPVDAVSAVQELLLDNVGIGGVTGSAVASATGVTLTTANFLAGIILRSGAVTVSDTTPTAAELIAAMGNPPDGQGMLLVIRNANTGTLTITAGSGVSLVGTTTIPTVNTRVYLIQKTGAATVSMTGLMVGAN